MAIGDAVALIMGTAQTDRQPSAGVEEKITMIVKDSTNDTVQMIISGGGLGIADAANSTARDMVDATQLAGNFYNMAMMITNTVFLRKAGTTDVIYAGGVQTNA